MDEENLIQTIETGYGDVILASPIYISSDGSYLINKHYISSLPRDVTEEELDDRWVKIKVK